MNNRTEIARKRTSARRALLARIKVRAGCAVCGYDDAACALDFNHFKGEKVADLTKMVTYRMDRIVQEIAKCVVLCANCHRRWTQNEWAG